jgi:hypothetical protein
MNSAHNIRLGIRCIALADPGQNAANCGGTSFPPEKLKSTVRTREVTENNQSYPAKNPPKRAQNVQKPYISVLFSTQKPGLNPDSVLPTSMQQQWSGPQKSEISKGTQQVIEKEGLDSGI